MSTRAKDLFEARIEYPLKPKPTPKTKDYIFYFVPATDPYGGSARKFLSKFYSAHVKVGVAKSVSSIEEMIGYLYDQVAAGVDHIREVVIVAHANPRGMVLKLLEDASETRNPEYQYLTFESLAILQKDFAEEKFATFKKKRARHRALDGRIVGHDPRLPVRSGHRGNVRTLRRRASRPASSSTPTRTPAARVSCARAGSRRRRATPRS